MAGALLGYVFLSLGTGSAVSRTGLYVTGLVSGVFIDLLKMLLVPLVFTSIAVGVANLRLHRQVHRVWQVTLLCSLATTGISIAVGLSAANIFHPGQGLQLESFREAMAHADVTSMSVPDFLARFLHGIFMNPVAAMAQGNVLAIVMFALFVGIAIVAAGDRYRNILVLLEEFFELTMQMVHGVMVLAPLGIMALIAKLVATENIAVLGSLARFVAVVMGTTLLHGIVILPLILLAAARFSPLRFWRGARPALVTAFATSSSAATMPVTLDCLENNLGVERDVANFVVPLGSHLNMDGTALYEAAAALFVANLAGVELHLGQQLAVCLTAMLASVGAPGIPSAGMVTMVMVLQSVGLPAEAVAILLPVDRLLDTVRTAVNVEGDMVTSLIVQRYAGSK
ncbi:MAG TPA: dicarboxylate/amino acid:cation symporter [Pseudomonadales bacterium]|nr:dicarboxylate/amino acid:cation symporter [Pseudomonadales bacterium]